MWGLETRALCSCLLTVDGCPVLWDWCLCTKMRVTHGLHNGIHITYKLNTYLEGIFSFFANQKSKKNENEDSIYGPPFSAKYVHETLKWLAYGRAKVTIMIKAFKKYMYLSWKLVRNWFPPKFKFYFRIELHLCSLLRHFFHRSNLQNDLWLFP